MPRFLQRLAPGARAAAPVRAALAPRFAASAPSDTAADDAAFPSSAAALPALDGPAPMRGAEASVESMVAPAADLHATVADRRVAPPGRVAPAPAPTRTPAETAPRTDGPRAPGPRRAAPAARETGDAMHKLLHAGEHPTPHPAAVQVMTPARSAMSATAARSSPDRHAPLRESTLAQHAALQRAAQAPTVVQVTIDRIDVRGAPETTPQRSAARARATSATSLGDYLRQRTPRARE